MSTVKSKKLQVGTDATATNNFTIYQPATPDGTLRIGVGNADSPTEVAQVTSSGLSVTGDLSVTGSVPANTGPSFKATMSAVTAISNAGATKLVLNLEEWDTNSNYDSATNYRFTPTVAGYYLITGSMFMSTATTARVGVAIYKNGSEHAWQFTAGVSSGGGANPQVSTIVYANGSSDYFELYAAQDYTSSVNASNNSVLTWFSGALVRAA
jgi:hypothetical protein